MLNFQRNKSVFKYTYLPIPLIYSFPLCLIFILLTILNSNPRQLSQFGKITLHFYKKFKKKMYIKCTQLYTILSVDGEEKLEHTHCVTVYKQTNFNLQKKCCL